MLQFPVLGHEPQALIETENLASKTLIMLAHRDMIQRQHAACGFLADQAYTTSEEIRES